MKIMQTLKTSNPIVSIGQDIPSGRLSALRSALIQGVRANPDPGRAEFFDVEVDGCWYFLHVPRRLARVYLVAFQTLRSLEKTA